MLKLIRLEWKKHTIWKYIRNAAITTAALVGLLLMMSSDPTLAELAEGTEKSVINTMTELILNMAYFAFTGVMLASFIVSEYESKQINLMYSYPIKRKRILLSKILSVCTFNIVALLLSKGIAYAVLLLVNFEAAASIHIGDFAVLSNSLLSAVISVCSGCIVLWVGMKMKSSKATIISAFVLMLVVMGITQGNVLPYTSVIGIIGYAIQLIGSFAAVFFSIRRVETEDVM